MLFNSILFLFFFSLVYVIYWNLRGVTRRNFLILASIVFYAAWGLEREGLWGLRWTAHFLAMALLNYILIRVLLRRSRGRDWFIRLIVILNLSNLGIFKYFAFLREVLIDVGLHLPATVMQFDIFLPLAISFYTFQMTAYAIDVHRGRITHDESLSRFLFFILFFPQLIAGPIMRSTDFMSQMDRPRISRRRLYDGCWLIMGGLFKKVLLADPMGLIIAPVYRRPEIYSGPSILLAGMGFSLQVYCDFSGYTDIARGCARLLGYEIPENFRAPFFSRSARELWQRWHITLATWLRDYIYIPLGGSRVAAWRGYFNLFVTFTLGGLWHGADYTFILWGAMWGMLLALERLLTRFLEKRGGIPTFWEKNRPLAVARALLMFLLFSIGALMFRSQKVVTPERSYSSGEIMQEIFTGIVANNGPVIRDEYRARGGDAWQVEMTFGPDVFQFKEMGPGDTVAYMFLALLFFHFLQYREKPLERWRRYDPYLLLLTAALLGGVLMPALATNTHQFIYFVF